MKYLALLKDSFREAVDSRVLWVTIVLSCAIAFAVGSISFRPLPASEALQNIITRFTTVYQDGARSLRKENFFVVYELRELQQLNDAELPYAGDYRFKLAVHDNNFRNAVVYWSTFQESDHSSQNDISIVTDTLMEKFIQSQFALHGDVETTSLRRLNSTPSKTIIFEVQTRGTRSGSSWPHEIYVFFGACALPVQMSPAVVVYWVEDNLVNGVGAWVGILVGVVITSFFIPHMLRQGRIDLLLAKPIHRTTLLVYKYVGGLTFIFVNASIAVLGVWLAVGLRSGIWYPGFLATILVLTFFFAILYTISTLFGVLTRSPTIAIVMTCLVWLLLWGVGMANAAVGRSLSDQHLPVTLQLPESIRLPIGVAHFLLPRTKDLDTLTTQLLSQGLLTEGDLRYFNFAQTASTTWAESFIVSIAFIAAMLGLSCWRFANYEG
jgi:ABC-type transport system involved in multi-copper enzyme maturation permease subunit